MNKKENKVNNEIILDKINKINIEENEINSNIILNKMDSEENKINNNIICRKRENNEEINIENIKKSKYFELKKSIKGQNIIENLKDINCKDKLDNTIEGKK